MARPRGVPKACLHRASGQAVVRLGGKDFYLGRWKSPEAGAAYHRKVAEWLSAGAIVIGGEDRGIFTVAELAHAYHAWAARYYRGSAEPDAIRLALAAAVALYGDCPVADFGPLALKAVRQSMLSAPARRGRMGRPLARSTINRRIAIIRRMFGWATEDELIAGDTYHRLLAVRGLPYGRGGREKQKRRPVPIADVAAVFRHLLPEVRAIVKIQWLTGMRSTEAVTLRTADIDRSGAIWHYTPARHKTERHEYERVVSLGRRAQRALGPWLREGEPEAWLFRPSEAEGRRKAAVRDARIAAGGGSGGNRKRRARRPHRAPGERYTADSYRRAVQRACEKAGVARWTPHQIRHAFGTRVRQEFDLDAARAALGHADANVTLDYAELDVRRSDEVAARLG